MVYEWPGSDGNLKPILCLAHQGMNRGFFHNFSHSFPVDVVPVDLGTVGEWDFPPYSGHFDGMSFLEVGDVITTTQPQERKSGDVAVLMTRADLSE